MQGNCQDHLMLHSTNLIVYSISKIVQVRYFEQSHAGQSLIDQSQSDSHLIDPTNLTGELIGNS